MNTKDRLRCLTLDEMEMTSSVQYNDSSKSVLGNVTLPGRTGQANHALVVMLGGMYALLYLCALFPG